MASRNIFVTIVLLLLLSSSSFGYTISGDISGAEWFGGITYVYAVSLDLLNPSFTVGLALLGNGPYLILNAVEGNYILFAFQDQDGDLVPSLDDYIGYYGEGFPELLEVTGNMSGIDIEVAPLPFTTITGQLTCDEGYFGPTYILAATDPDFQDIAHFGLPLTLDGNAEYTLFTDPGSYYVRAYLDADFSFSPSSSDPQTFWGAPGNPALINVQSSPAENINLALMTPPAVEITLTPLGTPIVIPATGGSFDFIVNGENTGTETAEVQVWMDITLPDGSLTDPVLGPVDLILPGGFVGDRTRSQSVAASAPEGDYSFNAYVGIHPLIVWDQTSFNFEKSATDGGQVIGHWTNEGDPFEDWMVSSGATALLPEGKVLAGAYPNPFNPNTTIQYTLPADSRVSITVHDLQGRQVAELVDGWRTAGQHEVTFDAGTLASGVYFYRIVTGQASVTNKMILTK